MMIEDKWSILQDTRILAVGPRGRIGIETARTKAKEARCEARPGHLGLLEAILHPFDKVKINLHSLYFNVCN